MNEKLIMLADQFQQTFVEQSRWKVFAGGLLTALEVTVLALILGIILGAIVASVRSAHDQSSKNVFIKIANVICLVYTTVIRGTPAMIQLLIMYFVIFASSKNMLLVAALTFGINSGAYVAEIIRGGIMSIDRGQMEASRSLGLGYFDSMRFIILPQAIKNILPALGNELITLFKDTSLVTVIGLVDITKAASIIQSRTYQALVPYFSAAGIYLVVVMILTWLLGRLERRLRTSDRH